LRLLLEDPSPSVRALAATLLGRQQPASGRDEPKPAAAAASPPAPVSASAAPSLAPPSEEATAGPLSPATGSADGDSGEAQARQLTQSGLKLLQRREFARAQKLFEKARHLCGREKKSAACGELMFDLSYHLGRAYEAQGYDAEAMAEYERMLKQTGHGPGNKAELDEAQAAVMRLAPRLGMVRITHSSGGKCQETTRWMPLGVHTIEVDGKKQEVTVRPDSPARVGSCP
jgi:hypothetical protein